MALRPNAANASSFLRFLDHTQRRTKVGRTPLDEWSARRRDLYLTTHNTHNRQTSMPPVGFEPHGLSRRATADLRLRPRGHWNTLVSLYGKYCLHSVIACYIKFNNCLTRCDLFSLLHFCRQLYMFRVLTSIISSWYSCNYSLWCWLTGSTAVRSGCYVGTVQFYLQQPERMAADPINLLAPELFF